MLIYGGENSRGNYLNDFWLLDLCIPILNLF